MFFGLRHDAVIGGNGKKHEIDAMRAGQHVLDEPLMARNVDYSGDVSIAEIELSETQVNGDAALFFFLKAVSVLACQGFDEAGFAVIDMSGGADNVRHDLNLRLQSAKRK